jgi:hypothetical protein
MSVFASSRENALATLVPRERPADKRLETAVCAMQDGSSDVEEVMVVAGDIRLERRRGEEYMALLSADGVVVLAYWLEIGFGRPVWTLATASATRARRALAEAGIREPTPAVPSGNCQVPSGVASE